MAEIKIDSFLILERTLSNRLRKSWKKIAGPLVVKILRELKEEDQTQIDILINSVDFGRVLRSNRKFMKFIARASFLFGVGRVQSIRKSKFVKNKETIPLLNEASETLVKVIELQGNIFIKRELTKAVNIIRTRDNEEKVTKAEIVRTNAEILANATGKRTDGYFETVSSLHNSRLAAWGYVKEAEAIGLTSYAVSEQVDSDNICPVCLTMHGKIFRIAEVEGHLEQLLTLDNLDDAKNIVSWPRQNKAAVERLGAMSNEELINNGWQTPPYHPRCRGLLVRIDDEENLRDLSEKNKERLPEKLLPGQTPREQIGPRNRQIEDPLRPTGVSIENEPLPEIPETISTDEDGIQLYTPDQQERVTQALKESLLDVLDDNPDTLRALNANPGILDRLANAYARIGTGQDFFDNALNKLTVNDKLFDRARGVAGLFGSTNGQVIINNLQELTNIYHQLSHGAASRNLLPESVGGFAKSNLAKTIFRVVQSEFNRTINTLVLETEAQLNETLDIRNPIHQTFLDTSGLITKLISIHSLKDVVEFTAEAGRMFVTNPITRSFLKANYPNTYKAMIILYRGDLARGRLLTSSPNTLSLPEGSGILTLSEIEEDNPLVDKYNKLNLFSRN